MGREQSQRQCLPGGECVVPHLHDDGLIFTACAQKYPLNWEQ